jgi:hypothetical protein
VARANAKGKPPIETRPFRGELNTPEAFAQTGQRRRHGMRRPTPNVPGGGIPEDVMIALSRFDSVFAGAGGRGLPYGHIDLPMTGTYMQGGRDALLRPRTPPSAPAIFFVVQISTERCHEYR